MTTLDTVLVIDDDPDFRELVRLYVETETVRVLEASDCAEGIELLRREDVRVALVLLDYWMPNMAPPCCCDKILALVPRSRVVLVTAAVDPARRAAELGLTQWLSKPFDLSVLGRIVKSACARPSDPDRMQR